MYVFIVFKHPAALVNHFIYIYVYIYVYYTHTVQSSLQPHILSVESPLSSCFRVNSTTLEHQLSELPVNRITGTKESSALQTSLLDIFK
jgi:hypothetical protein